MSTRPAQKGGSDQPIPGGLRRIIQASVTVQSNDVETAPSKRLLHRTICAPQDARWESYWDPCCTQGGGPLMMRRVKKYNHPLGSESRSKKPNLAVSGSSTCAPRREYHKHQPSTTCSSGMSRPASRRRLKYAAKKVRSVFGQTRSKNSGEKSGCISSNVLTAARASSDLPCPANAPAKFA